MKPLPKDQLHRVKPKFRAMVQKAWDNGEEVPESITLLSDEPLTGGDLKLGHSLELTVDRQRINCE